jgi:hypothetical protein
MQFTIELTGITQLTEAFAQSPETATPILQRALSASQAILAKNTTRETVPFRTGFLVQTFQAVMADLTLRWYPTASYARFVEFGTAPHMIYPKNAQALFWPGAEHPVRSVSHPGTAADDYMGRIIAASVEEINNTFGQALTQIVQAIAQQGNV